MSKLETRQHDAAKGLAIRRSYFFAPVYVTDGQEWVSTSQGSLLREEAERMAREFAAGFPRWAAANKFVRVARFELIESEESGRCDG